MSVKESKSLLFNDITWRVSHLGEKVILLECGKEVSIEKIHQSTFLIEELLGDKLKDIVPAYCSIAVFTDLSAEGLLKAIQNSTSAGTSTTNQKDVVELPICYELGLDLERVAKHVQLSEEDLITLHLKELYRSLFIGFTPGFIYADGLNEKLACPRLTSPRKKIPSGAVGIADSQTGIYSLASPGGWNIIGRTPTKIFDSGQQPPILIDVGTSYRFKRITKEEFESWEN